MVVFLGEHLKTSKCLSLPARRMHADSWGWPHAVCLFQLWHVFEADRRITRQITVVLRAKRHRRKKSRNGYWHETNSFVGEIVIYKCDRENIFLPFIRTFILGKLSWEKNGVVSRLLNWSRDWLNKQNQFFVHYEYYTETGEVPGSQSRQNISLSYSKWLKTYQSMISRSPGMLIDGFCDFEAVKYSAGIRYLATLLPEIESGHELNFQGNGIFFFCPGKKRKHPDGTFHNFRASESVHRRIFEL